MHIWGLFHIHPVMYPISAEFNFQLKMFASILGAVYGAAFQPTVEDFILLVRLID